MYRFSDLHKAKTGELPKNVISAAAQKSGTLDSDDDEEVFQDVDRVMDEQKKELRKVEKELIAKIDEKKKYDPLKREPKYSNATNTALWELVVLANHCHPTIRDWAESVSKGKSIYYGGDPLLDLGLSNFLDRIAYKNPRTAEKAHMHRQRMA